MKCAPLREAARESLAFLEREGFTFFRSRHEYRRKTETGYSYISINVTSHGAGASHLAFYSGVRIDKVESKKKELLQRPGVLSHWDRTVAYYSVNIGPESPHWSYPIRGFWGFSSAEAFDGARSEIERFARDILVPYVTNHAIPSEVRQTLLSRPRHFLSIFPWHELLSISLLYYDRETLLQDIDVMRTQLCLEGAGFVPPAFEDFATCVLRA